MDALALKEIICPENTGDILGDSLSRQFPDDQKVNAVAVFAKDIFFKKLQYVRIVTQFDFDGAGGGFVPVDARFALTDGGDGLLFQMTGVR